MLRGQEITQQLRIGNLFLNNAGELDQITSLSLQYIGGLDKVHLPSPEAEFVPLTEEWLERLGVEKQYASHRPYLFAPIQNFTILFEIEDKSVSVCMRDVREQVGPIPCEYVHQLQNLYFALTGTELTVNINTPSNDSK